MTRKSLKQRCAVFLVLVVLLTAMPLEAFSETAGGDGGGNRMDTELATPASGKGQKDGEATASGSNLSDSNGEIPILDDLLLVAELEELSDDILRQKFDAETAVLTDVILPETLIGKNGAGEKFRITGVAWECTAAGSMLGESYESLVFDPDTEGVYAFSPVLPEEYEVGDEVMLPVITVEIWPAGTVMMPLNGLGNNEFEYTDPDGGLQGMIEETLQKTGRDGELEHVTKLKLSGMVAAADYQFIRRQLSGLLEVDLQGVTSVFPDSAFYGSRIKRVRLPAGGELSSQMFYLCSNLETLVCGSGAMVDGEINLLGYEGGSYGSSVFSYSGIKRVHLPIEVELSSQMFSYCSNLETLVCGAEAMVDGEINLLGYEGGSYGSYVFSNSGIKRVRLPAGVELSDYMFYDCSRLGTLVCGDGAMVEGEINLLEYQGESYGEGVFTESGIKRVRLPAGVELSDYMFYDCSSLETLVCGDGAMVEGEINLLGYQGGSYGSHVFSNSGIKRARLPAGVELSDYMFHYCSSLETLVCGDGDMVEGEINLLGYQGDSYGEAVFSGSGIKRVRLPAEVELSNGMFAGYSNLETLVCGEGDMVDGEFNLLGYQGGKYGESVFSGTGVKTARLPAGVTLSAYMFRTCSSLKNIVFAGAGNPSAESVSVFDEVPAGGTIYYPKGSEAYSDEVLQGLGLTGWKQQENNPVLSAEPSALPFGGVETGTVSAAQELTVMVSDFESQAEYRIEGGNGAFQVEEVSWGGWTGGTLSVTFRPAEEKEYSAQLIISSTGVEARTIQLTGTGLAVPTYTVTYAAGGASGGTVPADGNAYAADALVTVAGNTGGLYRSGYRFAGWKHSGDGKVYQAGEQFRVTAHVILTAQWEKEGSSGVSGGSGGSGGSAAAGEWKLDAIGWWYQYTNGTYPKAEWKQIGGSWYYFDASGYMATGWRFLDGKWYWLNLGTGRMVRNDWIWYQDYWYYLGSDGAMVTGWLEYKEAWYFLSTVNDRYYGHMLRNQTTPDGYYVNQDGVRTP